MVHLSWLTRKQVSGCSCPKKGPQTAASMVICLLGTDPISRTTSESIVPWRFAGSPPWEAALGAVWTTDSMISRMGCCGWIPIMVSCLDGSLSNSFYGCNYLLKREMDRYYSVTVADQEIVIWASSSQLYLIFYYHFFSQKGSNIFKVNINPSPIILLKYPAASVHQWGSPWSRRTSMPPH